MDDSCAVCAEALQWIAYGQCGHREVCSTCVARLRFICDDQNCCICKSNLNVIFVTKALGDYTRMISDFTVFPSEPKEGKVGSYWYHKGTRAFFDDFDHYKMVKGMCRLLCIVCDKLDEHRSNNTKGRGNYKNVEQLKDHLMDRHTLVMCNLCLESKKVFICEQKVYTKEQLNQHINTGDSEVDGSEAERGGFMGHPMCEFCRIPFYGESELYIHMSTEHYTCHICQRQHPGHFEYYRNYDELEIHFRTDHILCEDEGCLAKKFIVFSTDSELNKHNAMEHGGRMSRSKRNAALQIPTSFRYERSTVQDRRRRGLSFYSDQFESELSRAVEASLDTTNDDMPHASSSGFRHISSSGAATNYNSRFRPLQLLSSTDSEPALTYHHQQGPPARNVPLEESSFPPLPVSTISNQQNSRSKTKGSGKNTMAARLRRQNNVGVLHSAHGWTSVSSNQPIALSNRVSKSKLTSTSGHKSISDSSSSVVSKPAAQKKLVPHNNATSGNKSVTDNERVSASSDRSSNINGLRKVNYSASEPNLVAKGVFCSETDVPPVSVTNTKNPATSNQPLVKVQDTKAANKSLVENIRAGLLYDEERYTIFKIISGEYRQGLINTSEYVAYVHQFGLSHLVSELAKLCPDAEKQRELLEVSSISSDNSSPYELSAAMVNCQIKQNKTSKKGKEKLEGVEIRNIKPGMANNGVSSIRNLHASHRPFIEEVEVVEKSVYPYMKGKSKVSVNDGQTYSGSSSLASNGNAVQHDSTTRDSSFKNTGEGNKHRKKTSKFHRVRLGEDSPAALLGLNHSESTPDLSREGPAGDDPLQKVRVGGVWNNGGGKKLVASLR